MRHIHHTKQVDNNIVDSLLLCEHLWVSSFITKDPAFLLLDCLAKGDTTALSNTVGGLCLHVTVSDDLLKYVDYPDLLLAHIAGYCVENNPRALLSRLSS